MEFALCNGHLPRTTARRGRGMTIPIKYLRDGSDGRLRRSARTKMALIEAYLDLLREKPQAPTGPEIAKRAGCSVRSVFVRFPDLLALSLAAADDAFEQATAQAALPKVDADLHIRLKSQVETRAAICERWLPLWRALLHYKDESEELASRIKRIRAAMVSRLELVYRPELSTLSEAERTQLLVVLDILTDFESWGRMREGYGLSIEAARDVWINAIGHMLPGVALSPAPGDVAFADQCANRTAR
jgi:AcrR family transcriptional regulator